MSEVKFYRRLIRFSSSLGLTIPKTIVEALGLKPKTMVEVTIKVVARPKGQER